MASKTASGLLLAVLSLGLTVGAAAALYQESGAYLRPGLTSIERARAAAADSGRFGLSHGAMVISLQDCITAMNQSKSLEMLYVPAPDREALYSGCNDLASNVRAQSPANGLAWLAGAHASLLTGDLTGFNADLATSQMVTPTEQWIAEQRVQLAEDNLEKLDGAALAAHDADLHMLVSGGIGLRSLAQRYMRDEAFRQRIAAIVETMPLENQQRFLNSLRSAIRNAGR
jgi:hypothetical protein